MGNIPCYYCFGCCYLAVDRSRVPHGYRCPLLRRRIRGVDECFRSRFRFRFRWCFVVDIDLGYCCFGDFVVVVVAVVVGGSCRLRLFRFLAAAAVVVVVVDDIDS